MRNVMFGALVALCLGLPVKATANAVVSAPQMEMEATELRIHDVLRVAAERLNMNLDCLCNAVANGTATVTQEGDAYRVTTGGGMAVILAEDIF